MKRIIYLIGVLSVLLSGGCVYHDHHRGGVRDSYEWERGHYRHYPDDRYPDRDYHRYDYDRDGD